MIEKKTFGILNLLFLFSTLTVNAITASERVQHSEQQTQGGSMTALVTMQVQHEATSREMKFRLWQAGRDKSILRILAPLKDNGTGSLRIRFDLWQYLPNANQVIRIPPSMMLQAWMGSDFTNDDLVKASSQFRDYTHAIEGNAEINHEAVTKVICTPKPDAPVVWGKIRLWLRTKDDVPLLQEFYNERGELLKTLEGSNIKTIGKHNAPLRLVMTNLKKPGHHTTMEFSDVHFDEALSDSIFTQENLRKAPIGESR